VSLKVKEPAFPQSLIVLISTVGLACLLPASPLEIEAIADSDTAYESSTRFGIPSLYHGVLIWFFALLCLVPYRCTIVQFRHIRYHHHEFLTFGLYGLPFVVWVSDPELHTTEPGERETSAVLCKCVGVGGT
jgi:hypothetical protein